MLQTLSAGSWIQWSTTKQALQPLPCAGCKNLHAHVHLLVFFKICTLTAMVNQFVACLVIHPAYSSSLTHWPLRHTLRLCNITSTIKYTCTVVLVITQNSVLCESTLYDYMFMCFKAVTLRACWLLLQSNDTTWCGSSTLCCPLTFLKHVLLSYKYVPKRIQFFSETFEILNEP